MDEIDSGVPPEVACNVSRSHRKGICRTASLRNLRRQMPSKYLLNFRILCSVLWELSQRIPHLELSAASAVDEQLHVFPMAPKGRKMNWEIPSICLNERVGPCVKQQLQHLVCVSGTSRAVERLQPFSTAKVHVCLGLQ
mmetsp:Transcript_7643/g.16754  ORF Transcript_7643/g.16754 Transcript_7643/m.16754 type:complete len:139 (-) Transcript_7643:74-490(-)